MRFVGTLLFSAGFVFAQEAPIDTRPVATFGTTVVIPSGLKGTLYYLKRYTTALPDFRRLKPRGTIYTTSLDVPPQDFKVGFPGVTKRFEWFALDYTGRFWVAKPGMHRFELTSDDGSLLYIDDQLIIDNDGTHVADTRRASLQLEGGIHRIRVSYFQGPRFMVALRLMVAPPGDELRVFSTDEFKPPPNPESWTFPNAAEPGKEPPAPAASKPTEEDDEDEPAPK